MAAADLSFWIQPRNSPEQTKQTFEVEEDIGLVVLEHLGYQLNIHILDIDLLNRYQR